MLNEVILNTNLVNSDVGSSGLFFKSELLVGRNGIEYLNVKDTLTKVFEFSEKQAIKNWYWYTELRRKDCVDNNLYDINAFLILLFEKEMDLIYFKMWCG